VTIRIDIPRHAMFTAWREGARQLLAHKVAPYDVAWHFDQSTDDLFAQGSFNTPLLSAPITVPREFIDVAEAVICHSDLERFALLYEALWRMQGDRGLIHNAADRLMARIGAMQKAVRRDCHKMKAFVRFKDVGASEHGRRRFTAWFEPEHFIVERTAPFFARRFADMDWTIATPKGLAHCLVGNLSFGAGVEREPVPQDAMDDLWRVYYANIFNPARLKVAAMTREMPKKYWNNLPEAGLIPELIAKAQDRASGMIMADAKEAPLRAKKIKEMRKPPFQVEPSPDELPPTVDEAKSDARGCTRCHLYKFATQTVFGEGPAMAPLMFVGEQPGDKEDLQGRPFVGPAGQLFSQMLEEAGIEREHAYITNAVKHFKFEPRGKFRLHKRPDTGEILACKWWLAMERDLVKPKLIVAMGATAAQSLTGNGQGILKRRGTFEALDDGTPVLITIHPSALLRIPDAEVAAAARSQFRSDLRLAADRIAA
jgi:uracil-DNA glycosylase